MPTGLVRHQNTGKLHFTTFSCYGRHPYLADDNAKEVFEILLERVCVRHGIDVHGYVIMPEHVHLLLSEPRVRTLESSLRVLKGESSKRLRGERERFWHKRYHDFDVYSEAKRIEKLRYLHRNPVARGLVAKPEDWPWSSFRHYATGEPGRVTVESPWLALRRKPGGNPLMTMKLS